jgi:hypothetical protein
MRQDELSVGAAPHIEFDTIGDSSHGQKPGECVVRKIGWPSPMPDQHKIDFFHKQSQKSVYKPTW